MSAGFAASKMKFNAYYKLLMHVTRGDRIIRALLRAYDAYEPEMSRKGNAIARSMGT